MTCIVGITDGNNIWMGCDGLISGDNDKFNLEQPKIIKKEEMLIGVAGTLRGLQLLKYHLDIDGLKEELEKLKIVSDEEFICNYLVTCIKNMFFEHQYCVQIDSQENQNDKFLIGYRGRLYYLDSNYQIFNTTDSYMAIGSGSEYAYGALRVQEKARILLKDPEEAIKRTIDVVSQFCPSTGGDIKVFNV